MGRESFYASNRLAFVTPRHELLGVSEIPGGQITRFKRLNDKLVEIKTQQPHYDMPDYSGDYYMPTYTYFLLDKTGVSEQTSSRTYNFTEFAKLDSSYITGSFYYWDQKTEELTEVGALGLPTLEFMRNEILAGYGLKFADSLNMARFSHYPQNVTDIAEIRSKLNETDRHNVEFLEKIIGLMGEKPAATKPI